MITDDTFYDMAERLADDYDYDKHGDIRAITFTPAQFIKYSRELIALAQQEPAQAAPDGYRLQPIAEFDAMNEYIQSSDAQKSIDSDTRKMVLELCDTIITGSIFGIITKAKQISERLEAGE